MPNHVLEKQITALLQFRQAFCAVPRVFQYNRGLPARREAAGTELFLVELPAMAKKRPRITVWVVMHDEVMRGEQIDSVQFHVSSSLKEAEKYISRHWVAPYSWWQVHPHVVDHDDSCEGEEGDEVYYYTHKGKPRMSAPLRRALAAFRKAAAKNPEWFGLPGMESNPAPTAEQADPSSRANVRSAGDRTACRIR